MRILAVDFGEKRIGLAVSDETGNLVVPVGAFVRKSDGQAAEVISEAAREREVERIVVGLPIQMDGSEGQIAKRARSFAQKLAAVCGVPVDLHGEGLTSVAAERNLMDAGIGPGRRAAALDAEAAAVLLRDYLSERSGSA